MATRLVHAVAAILTMILLFLRQRCAVEASASREASKRRVSAWSCGEWSRAALALFSAECVACARTAASCYQGCWLPKYKRDPEIMLDDENLGQHPSVQAE
ncbi:uncharacterized protein LOC118278099 [Spodoptera frugiperda]|uniref:Uncharacterized protein LOC118278099 n=1 Tax=Spodoptera frugiperda TaxID=7108 RepID=A0A9R0DH61_SPOFR|nr:uncharacterized protein LOC118278099 [Spodoptera frugiperda]